MRISTHSLEEHLAAWQGRMVCWGGLPGLLLDPSCPLKTFSAHVDRLRAVATGRRDVIVGVSDNVMPGAQWERLRHVSEVFCKEG